MARPGGNPDISKAGAKYRWKEGQSGNPKGAIKKFAFQDLFCEEFKQLSDAKIPFAKITRIVESLDAMTYDELLSVTKNKDMPWSVRTIAIHKLRAGGKNATAKDLQILTDLTKPKDEQVHGSELPPVPIVNLNIYAEKAQQNDD